jgi:hypothetical protein
MSEEIEAITEIIELEMGEIITGGFFVGRCSQFYFS